MNIKPLAVLLTLTLPLAACGNKGPLVRPSSAQMPPVEAPAPADTAPPADSDDSTPPADATPATTPPPPGNG